MAGASPASAYSRRKFCIAIFLCIYVPMWLRKDGRMNSLFPRFDFCRWDYIAILICSIPAFYLLGTPAIYIWDEAVYANASLDMSHGHSWWLPVQAAYNTKPPLVLWMQAISLKI